MSVADEFEELLELEPSPIAHQRFYALAARSKQISSNINAHHLDQLIKLFTHSGYDGVSRRYAGHLLLELLKHSQSAAAALRQVEAAKKCRIGQLILTPVPELLKLLAGAIIFVAQTTCGITIPEFLPDVLRKRASVFPTIGGSAWGNAMGDFLDDLAEHGIIGTVDTQLFAAVEISFDGAGKYAFHDGLARIICEYDEERLTCARISATEKPSWFYDIPYSYMRAVSPHPKQEAPGSDPARNLDQMSINLKPGSRGLFENGSRLSCELFHLILGEADDSKDIAEDLRAKLILYNTGGVISAVPTNGPIDATRSSPSTGMARTPDNRLHSQDRGEDQIEAKDSQAQAGQAPVKSAGAQQIQSRHATTSNDETTARKGPLAEEIVHDSHNMVHAGLGHTDHDGLAGEEIEDIPSEALDLELYGKPSPTNQAADGRARSQVPQLGSSTKLDDHGDPESGSNHVRPRELLLDPSFEDDDTVGLSAQKTDRTKHDSKGRPDTVPTRAKPPKQHSVKPQTDSQRSKSLRSATAPPKTTQQDQSKKSTGKQRGVPPSKRTAEDAVSDVDEEPSKKPRGQDPTPTAKQGVGSNVADADEITEVDSTNDASNLPASTTTTEAKQAASNTKSKQAAYQTPKANTTPIRGKLRARDRKRPSLATPQLELEVTPNLRADRRSHANGTSAAAGKKLQKAAALQSTGPATKTKRKSSARGTSEKQSQAESGRPPLSQALGSRKEDSVIARLQAPSISQGKSRHVKEAAREHGHGSEDDRYVDIDLVSPSEPTTSRRDPQDDSGRPGTAKASRREEAMMKDLVNLSTPAPEKRTSQKHNRIEDEDLPDDRSHRKPRIISFGADGPKNQGVGFGKPKPPTNAAVSHAPEPQPQPSSPLLLAEGVDSHHDEMPPNEVIPSPSLGAYEPYDDDEGYTIVDEAALPPQSRAETVFPKASYPHRTGSQLSQRVSGEGSPHAKSTKLPLAQTRAGHGLVDSDEHSTRRQTVHNDPALALQQHKPPVSTLPLPASTNPENDKGHHERREQGEKQQLQSNSIRSLQPVIQLQPAQTTKLSTAITVEPTDSNAQKRDDAAQSHVPDGKNAHEPLEKTSTKDATHSLHHQQSTQKLAAAAVQLLPKLADPRTVSEGWYRLPSERRAQSTGSSSHDTQVVQRAPAEEAEGDMSAGAGTPILGSERMVDVLAEPQPKPTSVSRVTEPEASALLAETSADGALFVDHLMSEDAQAPLAGVKDVRSRTHSVGQASEPDVRHEPAQTPKEPSITTHLELGSPARKEKKSKFMVHLDTVHDEQIRLEADDLAEDFDPDRTLVDDEDQEQGATDTNTNANTAFRDIVKQHGKPRYRSRSPLGVLQSNLLQPKHIGRAAEPGKTWLHTSPSSDGTTMFEADSRNDGEDDPQYTAYKEHIAWEEALQPHQKEYYTTFNRIANQLIGQIINNENAVVNTVKDYERGGLQLIQQLMESHREDAGEAAIVRSEARKSLGRRMGGLLAKVDKGSEQMREAVDVVKRYHARKETALEKVAEEVERMMAVWA